MDSQVFHEYPLVTHLNNYALMCQNNLEQPSVPVGNGMMDKDFTSEKYWNNVQNYQIPQTIAETSTYSNNTGKNHLLCHHLLPIFCWLKSPKYGMINCL